MDYVQTYMYNLIMLVHITWSMRSTTHMEVFSDEKVSFNGFGFDARILARSV